MHYFVVIVDTDYDWWSSAMYLIKQNKINNKILLLWRDTDLSMACRSLSAIYWALEGDWLFLVVCLEAVATAFLPCLKYNSAGVTARWR